ncbi:hypothetical protein O3P69_009053 [Scylla paramamosain]|uniref:Uncharacterized protein n=1 Tax=Scylla paramamosain TaxID=85552 RepID=A0AAW0TR52_SCYPA
MIYDDPGTGEFWGKLTVNGSWDGLVGMLARGEADIVVANLFVADVKGRTEFQEYTSPHGQVETCFMIRKPSPLAKWQSVALPYTLEVWLAVLVVILLAGPVLHALVHSSVSRVEERLACRSLPYLSLYTLAMHLRVSQTVVPFRTSLQVELHANNAYVVRVATGDSGLPELGASPSPLSSLEVEPHNETLTLSGRSSSTPSLSSTRESSGIPYMSRTPSASTL